MNEVKQMVVHTDYHGTAGGQLKVWWIFMRHWIKLPKFVHFLLTLMAGEAKGSDNGTWEHIATWVHFNKYVITQEWNGFYSLKKFQTLQTK